MSVLEWTGPAGRGEFCVLARRSHSLSPRGRALVLGSLLVVSLIISLPFAWFGAWLVAPFAGVDLLALCLAFRYLDRREGDFESIAVDGEEVIVVRRRGRLSEQARMSRYWAQVVAGPGGSGLVLRSHGREVAFGADLAPGERDELQRRLQRMVGPAGVMPGAGTKEAIRSTLSGNKKSC